MRSVPASGSTSIGDRSGSASASYRVAESLKLGVDLSRRNRPDMGNQSENMIMFELKGTFP